MKMTNNPITLPFLSTFLIILSITSHSHAATSPNPVLDTEGHNLQTGIYYYILPAISRGGGGGLTLAAHNATTTCPLSVVQDQNELNNGLPLTFSPVNLTNGVVRVSTDLNIKFSATPKTVCTESSVWRLDSFDESAGKSFVTTGGVEGNPGRETLSNWFKIEQYDNYYKLAFCPGVCGVEELCSVLCGDIGVYVDGNGTRRLAVSDVPLKVMFKKV